MDQDQAVTAIVAAILISAQADKTPVQAVAHAREIITAVVGDTATE